jgi:hypothetical protein
MRCAAIPALTLAVALMACADRSSDAWYRAQGTPDQASTDERACRDEATQVARQRSRQDANILEDRNSAADYSSATIWRSDLNINRYEQLATVERENIRDLTRACMADHGYRRVRDQ